MKLTVGFLIGIAFVYLNRILFGLTLSEVPSLVGPPKDNCVIILNTVGLYEQCTDGQLDGEMELGYSGVSGEEIASYYKNIGKEEFTVHLIATAKYIKAYWTANEQAAMRITDQHCESKTGICTLPQ